MGRSVFVPERLASKDSGSRVATSIRRNVGFDDMGEVKALNQTSIRTPQ